MQRASLAIVYITIAILQDSFYFGTGSFVTSKTVRYNNASSRKKPEQRHEAFSLTVHSSNRRQNKCSSRMMNRSDFVSQLISFSLVISAVFLPKSDQALAFDGGAGGLGKVKPSTGIKFRDADASPRLVTAFSGGEMVTNELIAPDGTIALVTFQAPWPLLQSPGQIEARDLQNPESAFVQVTELSKGDLSKYSNNAESLPKAFFADAIFGSNGKFGAYGSPFDVSIKKVSMGDASNTSTEIVSATFTKLTPGLRESPRKVYIAYSIVGNGVFMLVTGTTQNRFKSQGGIMLGVAESFRAIEAPKSGMSSARS